MSSEYLIVHKKILPDYLEKVLKARNMLASHEAETITEAVQKAGISRNTYYKYKDYVYDQNQNANVRHAVISAIIKDESGALSSLIRELTDHRTSILTISQSIPIDGKANVLISLDISSMSCPVNDLIAALKELPSVRRVHLDAVE
ncbi:MAG: ACT domain-containing protein [Solobacterium sp.]|nr:ACT domain-containing protein [Solobacterium sp.]